MWWLDPSLILALPQPSLGSSFQRIMTLQPQLTILGFRAVIRTSQLRQTDLANLVPASQSEIK
jgi:hypothetical protein